MNSLDVLYSTAVAPLGWIGRAVGYDPLQLKPSRKSTWLDHDPARVQHHARAAARALRDQSDARYVIGISAFYHDSAVALLKDGVVIAAAQEERFTRRKHDSGFPEHALKYCLGEAKISIDEVALVVFYEDPSLKFKRLLKTFIAFAPEGRELFRAALPVWTGGKLRQRELLAAAIRQCTNSAFEDARLVVTEHHLSHAASAFFPSPFEQAAILTIDGVGESATTTLSVGRNNEFSILKEIQFPHSLGLLYSAFTVYTGFVVNSGEYKLMGLAPYGRPKYADIIRDRLIELKDDGSFWLNMEYFEFGRAVRTIGSKFEDLFGERMRKPEEKLTQVHMDLAASVQVVLQDAVLNLGRYAAKQTGMENLCLAGGVALNCVSNGHLLRSGLFKNIWIQPAAGDAGGALGAAFVGHTLYARKPRAPHARSDGMSGAYLGPRFTQQEIVNEIAAAGGQGEWVEDDQLFDSVASALAEGKAVGWFSGRMEFGPRSLGARSILADPRSPTMQRILNLKIKNRESFRPFAPAVLREDVSEWFQLETDSPYMLLVSQVQAQHTRRMSDSESALFGIDMLNVVRSNLPAVTHVDYSARIQTVSEEQSPRFHRLLSAFKAKTGMGVLVNTSFNIRGEPIVCTPKDAYRCLMGTALDLLVVENYIIKKDDQPESLKQSYFHEVPLD